MGRTQLLALSLALGLSHAAWGAGSNSGLAPPPETSPEEVNIMKLSLARIIHEGGPNGWRTRPSR
jgi:hypothetical protein